MQKKEKTAFSLIELSIVILIVSILVTGSIGISKTAIGNSKNKITKERMDTIYKALSNFVVINRRLPCPSVLTLAKGTAGYGAEAATPGTCTGITANGNTVYGMIPISALGLNPDMGEDGFGTKFSYVVDKRFTKQSASTASTDGFEIVKAVKAENGAAISPTLIRVQGPSGTDILPDLNALFVLISHGANKNSGWNATGTAQNPAGSVADETANSFSGFNNIFIAYSTDPNFDDILLFKTKPQLVRNAGMEFMMCNAAEAQTSTKTWTTNGLYGCNVCSTTANNNKTCGKYGVWSSLYTSTCVANTASCSISLDDKAGSVIQVQQAIKTDVFTSSSASWVDWTGMSVNITETAGRSTRSLFKISFSSGVSNSSSNSFQYVRLIRRVSGVDTLIAAGNAVASAQRAWVDAAIGDPGGVSYMTTLKPLSAVYVDTPNTTSTITYKLQVIKTNGGTSYYGRTADIGDGNRSSVPSILIVEEIAQ